MWEDRVGVPQGSRNKQKVWTWPLGMEQRGLGEVKRWRKQLRNKTHTFLVTLLLIPKDIYPFSDTTPYNRPTQHSSLKSPSRAWIHLPNRTWGPPVT